MPPILKLTRDILKRSGVVSTFLSSDIFNAMGNQQSTLWTKQEEKAAGNVGQGGQGGRGGQGGHGGKYRRSSLLWAVFSNREEEIDLLLAEKSVDVNAKDHKNNTALHHACLLPDGKGLSMLTKLLDAPGILVNVKNCDGRTPIMVAIARGWTEGVKPLAAVDQVDLGSAEHFARYDSSTVKQPDIVQVLVEANQRRREKRERLVREQRREVSKVLLVGLYKDEGSPLNKLRTPRNVVQDVMPIIWRMLECKKCKNCLVTFPPLLH